MMIFGAIADVSAQIAREIGASDRGCSLQKIVNIVCGYTEIDDVTYIGVNTALDNPIWGGFRKYAFTPPYSSLITRVEIRYATHLAQEWKRFVVIKELCHSLDKMEGTCTVSDADVRGLIAALSLSSVGSTAGGSSPGFSMEKVAEVGAIEVMIPLSIRERILAAGPVDESRIADIARDFDAPARYVELALDPGYMEIARDFFGPKTTS